MSKCMRSANRQRKAEQKGQEQRTACGALTAVLSCAKAGCCAALASPTAGSHNFAMRFTAVDRFTGSNRCSSLPTIASTSCK